MLKRVGCHIRPDCIARYHSLEEFLRAFEYQLLAEENWACADSGASQTATISEKFDSMWIQRYYQLFPLAMFIHLLE